jgi:hypothetical protein
MFYGTGFDKHINANYNMNAMNQNNCKKLGAGE